ncbi:MAG TPA: VOC family protein [Rubrivivax sp.]
MSVALDHLVVAAASLEQGVAWCEATLGVTPGPGGQHPLMGTHNRLLKIATEAFPDAYLEIIAIDADATAPTRARWFGLDDPALQARLQERPRLIHFVARSTMLDMHRWGLISVGLKPGDPVRAGRETPAGPLAWQILVRDDGRLECGGALPTLIQWDGRHPAQAMPDSGVTLRALALRGVPDRASALLQLRGLDVQAGAGPALRATLQTPTGAVILESA